MNDIAVVRPVRQQSQREQSVYEANEFIRKYRYDLSAQAQKLLLFLITKIDRDDESFRTITFSMSEYCNVCGITKCGANFRHIKKTLDDLVTAPIIGPDGDMFVQIPGTAERVRLQFIIEPTIHADTKKISVTISPTMQKFLLHLRGNFTSFELQYVLCLNKYSIRLYQFIKSVHYDDYNLSAGPMEWNISLQDFRDVVGVADDKYPEYRSLNQTVILPALRDIELYTDKHLTIEPCKNGRSVVRLNLVISTKTAEELIDTRARIGEKLAPEVLHW